MILIDTNVAIFLQDGHADIRRRLLGTGNRPAISLITRIELEGGIADAVRSAGRREALDDMLHVVRTLPCDDAVVRAYAAILESTDFSRRRTFDRLIAATAIVHDLNLVTTNGPDFADVPGLRLEVWPRPA